MSILFSVGFLTAVWFLLFGVSGITNTKTRAVGIALDVIAIVIGILMMIQIL